MPDQLCGNELREWRSDARSESPSHVYDEHRNDGADQFQPAPVSRIFVGREKTSVARRLMAWAAAGAVAACGGASANAPAPSVPRPLPVGAMVGADVVVYPLTMVLAEGSLQWDDSLRPRVDALRRVDSLIAAALTERTPEVTWVLPDELRQAARRAPGLLINPDRMATATLRHNLSKVPDPLRSQMRMLTGVIGDRLALVPASLLFFEAAELGGRAELTMVLTDVRLGEIRWRSVVRGTGPTPWRALEDALQTLSPGLP